MHLQNNRFKHFSYCLRFGGVLILTALIAGLGGILLHEFLDLIEYNEEEYVILLPVEDEISEEPGEVVILKVESTSEDEESYVSVEDEEVLNNVFEIFKEKFKDEFNFTD